MYQWLRSAGSGRPTRSDEDVLVTNYMFLRKAVGLLGTFLPFILLAFNPIFVTVVNNGCGLVPDSISGYYYSSARNIFVGGLCALGLFLIAYVGYDLGDRQLTDAAGVFAVCVADSPQPPPQKLLRNLIYKICAIVILASLVAAVITNFLPASVRAHFPWWLFLYEALAIFAFGVSWFVKGQTLIGPLKDAPPVAEPVIAH
jgi:hypothetical protein